MDTITLILPSGETQELRIVSIRGERQLQGFADTGVFRITTVSQGAADDRPKTDCRGDGGPAFATAEITGNLDFARSNDGDHPYNRYGQGICADSFQSRKSRFTPG